MNVSVVINCVQLPARTPWQSTPQALPSPVIARKNTLVAVSTAAFVAFFATAVARAELVCSLGQADFTSALTPANELAAQAAALKAPAKAAASAASDDARAQRLQLAYVAIEGALKFEAINDEKGASTYWRIASKDLGDTRWRMSQQVKNGDAMAQWLAMELQQHDVAAGWSAQNCQDAFTSTPTLLPASWLYRKALCAATAQPKIAAQLMQDAATAGHPAAMEVQGRFCAAKGDAGLECAVLWLCRAADAGRKSAAGLAAFNLTAKTPTPGHAVKAAALYEMAFSAGDVTSANNLGEIYERGWIGRSNIKLAAQWYRAAADKGLMQAKLNLARLLWPDPATRAQARDLIQAASAELPAEAKQLSLQLAHDKD
jgi:TPR repeat protein